MTIRVAIVREKSLENETFFQSGKSRGILVWVREIGKKKKKKMTEVKEKSGIPKFSENWDGYGSPFNFQKHKFTELALFFC